MDASGSWAKPGMDDLRKWHEFLNSLNWPVKQQIVTIFNEPNHAKEWGGEINPREYALVLEKLTNLLKEANPNFVVLNAGLDQAADGRNATMTEAFFLSEMRAAVPDIFNKLDGWASHSYPNHGFVGLPDNTGPASVRGYEWELNTIKNLGGTKELPVFITETGWPHAEGMVNQPGLYESIKIAQYTEKTFSIWEEDDRVKAATPFVLNYPLEPFDHFSWLKQDGSEYEQFSRISSLPKVSGLPEQQETYSVISFSIPDLLPTNYVVKTKLIIRNTGQWIMGERHDVNFQFSIFSPRFGEAGNFQNGKDVSNEASGLTLSNTGLAKGELIFPGEEKTFDLMVQTGTQSAEEHLSVAGRDYTIYIYKPFDLTNKKVNLWQQMMNKLKLWLMEIGDK
jgi:hypothetical protein